MAGPKKARKGKKDNGVTAVIEEKILVAAAATEINESLADELARIATGMIDLTDNRNRRLCNEGIEAAIAKLEALGEKAQELQGENDEAVKLLEAGVATLATATERAAKAEAAVAELTPAMAELTEFNEGFVGIEKDLATVQAQLAAEKKAHKAGLATAAKAAKATAANDLKLARAAKTKAEKALAPLQAKVDEQAVRIANIYADLKAYGVQKFEDLAALVAAKAEGEAAAKAAKAASAKAAKAAKALTADLEAARAAAGDEGAKDARVAELEADVLRLLRDVQAAAGELKVTRAAKADMETDLTKQLHEALAERDAARAIMAGPPADGEGSDIDGETFSMAEMQARLVLFATANKLDITAVVAANEKLEGPTLALARTVCAPLIEAGFLVGAVPATFEEMEGATELPVKLADGADRNALLAAAVDAIAGALAPRDLETLTAEAAAEMDELRRKASALDGLIAEDTLAMQASRRKLLASFGAMPETDVHGFRTWEVLAPRMEGFAIRNVGGTMTALYHRATIAQPFMVEFTRGGGNREKVQVCRIDDSPGRLRLMRPDEKLGTAAGFTDLTEGDAIVAVHRPRTLAAKKGSTLATVAEGVARELGFFPGIGSMALPAGQKHVVDRNGTAVVSALVNLDVVHSRLCDESLALGQ